MGKKAESPDRIEAAIDAFEAALEIYELRRKHRQAAVIGKNLDRARDLLEHMMPKKYLPRELLDLDGPRNDDPSSNPVDASDIGADGAGGAAVH